MNKFPYVKPGNWEDAYHEAVNQRRTVYMIASRIGIWVRHRKKK